LGRAASTAAHEHCCVAGAATQPVPCSLRSHPSVVMQISSKLHMRKGCPPASTPGQPALGGGHWKCPLGKQAPASEPPPELDAEADEELEVEPPPPELEAEPDEAPELAPDEEPVLPELLPQARWPVAMVIAAMARSEVTVRTGGASRVRRCVAYHPRPPRGAGGVQRLPAVQYHPAPKAVASSPNRDVVSMRRKPGPIEAKRRAGRRRRASARGRPPGSGAPRVRACAAPTAWRRTSPRAPRRGARSRGRTRLPSGRR
jgi:hypothetical protein